MDQFEQVPQVPQRSWWGRNWKWVVPVGCLTPIVVCGGLITLIVVGVFSALKSSEAYTEALAKARANDQVKALLGEPIEPAFWVGGNLNVSGASGDADLMIPISGPKGSATLYVTAHQAAGKWEYATMQVAPAGEGARIDLLGKPAP